MWKKVVTDLVLMPPEASAQCLIWTDRQYQQTRPPRDTFLFEIRITRPSVNFVIKIICGHMHTDPHILGDHH